MPNRTIYISPDNLPEWEEFKNTHGSVNNFLSQGVSSLRSEPEDSLSGMVAGLVRAEYVDEAQFTEDEKGMPVYKPIPKELQPKLCPNGHPIPAGRAKCLGKGCKYS